jgi:Leu/Phe-tRNA-protein transferase
MFRFLFRLGWCYGVRVVSSGVVAGGLRSVRLGWWFLVVAFNGLAFSG